MAGKVDNSLIKSGANADVCLESELMPDGDLNPSEMTPSESDISNFSAESDDKRCLVPNDKGPGLLPRIFSAVAANVTTGAKKAEDVKNKFKEIPDLNAFRPLWPKGEPFDKNPLELNYSGDASRVFGQTGIAKELAHIKKTDPKRYAAIEEYFARFFEIESFLTDANASKNVKLEYIEFGIERLKELAKEADLESLYEAATAREQNIYWEYKAGHVQYALSALAVTASEEISDYEEDKRELLLEIVLNLKASLSHESDIPQKLGNRARVLQELNNLSDPKKGLNVEKELDSIIAELKNDNGDLARSGVSTEEILNYNERLFACAKKLAEFHAFYGRFEKSSASYGYPREILSRIEGSALYAKERVQKAFERGGIEGLAKEFGAQVGDILSQNMNEELLKSGSVVKIGVDIVKHSGKRREAISKGYSEGLSREDLLKILKGLDADTNALDRLLEAAEGLKREESLYKTGERLSNDAGVVTSHSSSRRKELFTAMTKQMAPVEEIIASLIDGSIGWSDLCELEKTACLKALTRMNTITANQGMVVFNNGAHRLGSTGDGKLARSCNRNRIGIGDASAWGTRDVIDDLVRKGETEWAQHDDDIDNITWRIERFERQLRIARLEDSIEGEQKFLDGSKEVAKSAAEYPILFGRIDLEKHSPVGAINEHSSLPYLKRAEETTSGFRHRLNEIMAKGFDEGTVSVLEREVNRYFISRERNDLGYYLGEDKEYLKWRSEVWFYEGIAEITLAGWAAGGVAGWVANGAKGLGAGKAAAHAIKLVPEGILFHAGTRSFGHEGWNGPLSETEGFARSIAMLGYIGAVGKPVRAWQMERIQNMAIANVKEQVAAGTAKKVTKELIAAEVKSLSESMLLGTAHSAEWFAFEYPAFQGFSAGWNLGGNLATVLTGGKVTPETWFGRHIFEGASWKEGFKTLVGLRFGGALRSNVQKVRVSKLQKRLAESGEKVRTAQRDYLTAVAAVVADRADEVVVRNMLAASRALKKELGRRRSILRSMPDEGRGGTYQLDLATVGKKLAKIDAVIAGTETELNRIVREKEIAAMYGTAATTHDGAKSDGAIVTEHGRPTLVGESAPASATTTRRTKKKAGHPEAGRPTSELFKPDPNSTLAISTPPPAGRSAEPEANSDTGDGKTPQTWTPSNRDQEVQMPWQSAVVTSREDIKYILIHNPGWGGHFILWSDPAGVSYHIDRSMQVIKFKVPDIAAAEAFLKPERPHADKLFRENVGISERESDNGTEMLVTMQGKSKEQAVFIEISSPRELAERGYRVEVELPKAMQREASKLGEVKVIGEDKILLTIEREADIPVLDVAAEFGEEKVGEARPVAKKDAVAIAEEPEPSDGSPSVAPQIEYLHAGFDPRPGLRQGWEILVGGVRRLLGLQSPITTHDGAKPDGAIAPETGRPTSELFKPYPNVPPPQGMSPAAGELGSKQQVEVARIVQKGASKNMEVKGYDPRWAGRLVAEGKNSILVDFGEGEGLEGRFSIPHTCLFNDMNSAISAMLRSYHQAKGRDEFALGVITVDGKTRYVVVRGGFAVTPVGRPIMHTHPKGAYVLPTHGDTQKKYISKGETQYIYSVTNDGDEIMTAYTKLNDEDVLLADIAQFKDDSKITKRFIIAADSKERHVIPLGEILSLISRAKHGVTTAEFKRGGDVIMLTVRMGEDGTVEGIDMRGGNGGTFNIPKESVRYLRPYDTPSSASAASISEIKPPTDAELSELESALDIIYAAPDAEKRIFDNDRNLYSKVDLLALARIDPAEARGLLFNLWANTIIDIRDAATAEDVNAYFRDLDEQNVLNGPTQRTKALLDAIDKSPWLMKSFGTKPGFIEDIAKVRTGNDLYDRYVASKAPLTHDGANPDGATGAEPGRPTSVGESAPAEAGHPDAGHPTSELFKPDPNGTNPRPALPDTPSARGEIEADLRETPPEVAPHTRVPEKVNIGPGILMPKSVVPSGELHLVDGKMVQELDVISGDGRTRKIYLVMNVDAEGIVGVRDVNGAYAPSIADVVTALRNIPFEALQTISKIVISNRRSSDANSTSETSAETNHFTGTITYHRSLLPIDAQMARLTIAHELGHKLLIDESAFAQAVETDGRAIYSILDEQMGGYYKTSVSELIAETAALYMAEPTARERIDRESPNVARLIKKALDKLSPRATTHDGATGAEPGRPTSVGKSAPAEAGHPEAGRPTSELFKPDPTAMVQPDPKTGPAVTSATAVGDSEAQPAGLNVAKGLDPAQRYVVIVDAYSTAAQFAEQFEKLGYKVIHVHSTAQLPWWYGTPKDANFVFDGDVAKLASELKKYHVDAVINGTDYALDVADRLSEALGVPNNDIRLSRARRDKYEQVLALEKAGVSVPKTFATGKIDEALQWVKSHKNWPVVVKPLEAAGSEGVYICRNTVDVEVAFRALVGKKTTEGIAIDKVLVQEYLEGEEYIIDLATSRGEHIVTDGWKYKKTTVQKPGGGTTHIREYNELIPVSKINPALIEYAKQVATVLGVRNGPTHIEVIMTKDGPRLVELNPRIVGAGMPKYVEAAGSENPAFVAAMGLVRTDLFEQQVARARANEQPGRLVRLISTQSGKIKGIPFVDKLRALPSYSSHHIAEVGDTLSPTIDLDTCPGTIFLTHSDPKQIERDTQKIREWERKGFFILEPEKAPTHDGATRSETGRPTSVGESAPAEAGHPEAVRPTSELFKPDPKLHRRPEGVYVSRPRPEYWANGLPGPDLNGKASPIRHRGPGFETMPYDPGERTPGVSMPVGVEPLEFTGRTGENIGIESAIWKIISGPEREGLPKKLEVQRALLGLAKGHSESVKTVDDALKFWDGVAKGNGYESLETYLMLRFGYHAAAILPSEMRPHAIEEADNVESGELKESKQQYVVSRSEEIAARLIDGGMDDIEARELAETIAAVEFYHPEWKGKLRLGDFADGQFAPTAERESFFAKLSDETLEDLFPEYDLRPGMPDTLANLTHFLENYRRAERHYYSPSLGDVHCFRSAARVLMLLRSKGFDARTLHTHKYLPGGTTRNHVIVLATIDGVEYAIDINHQQFGPANDKLIIVPRNEIGTFSLRERGDQLGLEYDAVDFVAKAEQKAVREYRIILGLLPKTDKLEAEDIFDGGVSKSTQDEVKGDEYRFDPERGLFLNGKALNTKTIRIHGDDIYIIARKGDYPEAWKVDESGRAEQVPYGFYNSLRTHPEIEIGGEKIPIKILEESGDVFLVEAKGIGLMAWQEEPIDTNASSGELREHYFPKSGKLYRDGKMIAVKVVKEGSVRLLKEAGSNRLTAWNINFNNNGARKSATAFFAEGSELFYDGKLSSVQVVEKSGNAYVLKQRSPAKTICVVRSFGPAGWQIVQSHYLPEVQKVFYAGRVLDAKIIEQIGDNVLIEAKKYDGPVAWHVYETGVAEPAGNIYFSKSRKLTTDYGRAVEVRILAHDGRFYFLKDPTPHKGRAEFVVKVDPDTGKIQRIGKYFFRNAETRSAGDYFSPETGWCNALVVDGDLFSEKNAEAFEILDRYFKRAAESGEAARAENVILVDGNGRAFENEIYPDPSELAVFWVTDKEGRVNKVTANRIGNTPYYIFNLPQQIISSERTYDGSGDAGNVYVYFRNGHETRRVEGAEVEKLALSRLGRNWPSLIAPQSVSVFSDQGPIQDRGKQRINEGYSWKVRVTSDKVDRFIEVKIESTSIEEARVTLDSTVKTIGQMPVNLFKTVKVIEIYRGSAPRYGFKKRANILGQFDGNNKTCRLFEINAELSAANKDTFIHELIHSITLDSDRENILLAIAADGHHAKDNVIKGRGDYGMVAVWEWAAEIGAMLFDGRRDDVIAFAPFTASALTYMSGRFSSIFEAESAKAEAKAEGLESSDASEGHPWSEDPIAERKGLLAGYIAAEVKNIDGIIADFRLERGDELLRRIDKVLQALDELERLGVKSNGPLKAALLIYQREYSLLSEPEVMEIKVPDNIFDGSKNRIVFGRTGKTGDQPDVALGGTGIDDRDISRELLVFERGDDGSWTVKDGSKHQYAKIVFSDVDKKDNDPAKDLLVGEKPKPIPSGRYDVIVRIRTSERALSFSVNIPPKELPKMHAGVDFIDLGIRAVDQISGWFGGSEAGAGHGAPIRARLERGGREFYNSGGGGGGEVDERLQLLRSASKDLKIDFYQYLEDLYGKEFLETAGVSIDEAKNSILFMTSDWLYIKGRLSKKFPGLPELIEEREEGGARVQGPLNPPSLTLDGGTYYFTLKYLSKLRIGRSQESDVHVADSMVSKNHAKIIRKGEKYYIVDEKSRNGIRIERGGKIMEVEGGGTEELLDGDVLLIGGKRLAVSMPFQRPKAEAERASDRSGEVLQVGEVQIEGIPPRVKEAEVPQVGDADPLMSRSMVIPVGAVSELPIKSEPVEIYIRGEKGLKPGKYVGNIERVLTGEEWKFRFTDDAGAARIIDAKNIVAISRRNGSESNRRLNEQFVRAEDPQFKQGACNISRKGKMIIVDFRDERLTRFLEEKIGPVWKRLNAGKINREEAAREAWRVVRTYTDYDYDHAEKGIPHYLYSLGEFVDKGVCNERGMLLQVALQYLGIESKMEKGSFEYIDDKGQVKAGRHAWVRLMDSEARELVLDPQHKKPLSPDDDKFYKYQDDGTPFDLEELGTRVISVP